MSGDRQLTLKTNPKSTFENKPKFALRAHATMRIHDKRIEIGFRIPPDMEEHLYKFLSDKRKSRKKK
jgi:hypothetical protein